MSADANPPPPRNDFERALVEDIDTHGFRVNSVFADRKTRSPRFSYSVGIQKTCGAPELIIFGMHPSTALDLMWRYFDRVKNGQRMQPHRRYEGFLDGYRVFFQPATRRREQYMLSCNWYYGAGHYQALQLIYPHPADYWPWSRQAMPRFAREQTLLCPVPLGQSRIAAPRRKPLNRLRLIQRPDGQSR